jgi:predicted MFS family arabinose efflux permease
MDVLSVVSLVACAFPVSFAWFFSWRIVSGIAGGTTMVLVAATILPHVPPARRGIVSGGVFLGIGVGMVASGTVVPLLLSHGIQAAWLGLATLCGALTVLSWRSWPEICRTCPKLPPAPLPPLEPTARRLIHWMYLQFSLMALSLVPTMLFLADYVARDLKLGTATSSWCWMACGLGAVIGPPLNGYVADKVGGRTAIRLAFLEQTIALALFSRAASLIAALGLSVVIGTFVSGSVPLILAWLRQALPNSVDRQNVVWARSTYFFASAQVLGGYVSSAALRATDGNHRPLFLGAACLLATAWAFNVLHRAAPSSGS